MDKRYTKEQLEKFIKIKKDYDLIPEYIEEIKGKPIKSDQFVKHVSKKNKENNLRP